MGKGRSRIILLDKLINIQYYLFWVAQGWDSSHHMRGGWGHALGVELRELKCLFAPYQRIGLVDGAGDHKSGAEDGEKKKSGDTALPPFQGNLVYC